MFICVIEWLLCFFKDEPSKAESVAVELRLKNIEVKLSEENEQGLTYLKFTKLVRHLIVEAKPSAAHTKINMHF